MVEYEQIRQEMKISMSRIMRKEPYLCVLYGSYHRIYDETTDVDLCIYAEEITQEQRRLIASEVENLHKRHGLLIDSDMKYINKTAFSREDIDLLKSTPPFPMDNGRIVLTPITYERSFLDSPQMRLRLLINIFTTNSILMLGDPKQFEAIVAEMYGILLTIVDRTSEKDLLEEQVLEKLLYDNSKAYSYKSFLGYNPNDVVQRCYIEINIHKAWKERRDYICQE